jgi:hypothetical protein
VNGLVIKPKWADLILSGDKPWEIRSGVTHKRGTIGIIKSGSGLIYGTAELTDCINLSLQDIADNRDKHLIPADETILNRYKKIFAWVFKNPIMYPEPIPYIHPQGAVIWVRLPDIQEGVQL